MSLYEREPTVPPVRISHLPRRRVAAIGLPAVGRPDRAALSSTTVGDSEPSYADFIGGPATFESPRLESEQQDAS